MRLSIAILISFTSVLSMAAPDSQKVRRAKSAIHILVKSEKRRDQIDALDLFELAKNPSYPVPTEARRRLVFYGLLDENGKCLDYVAEILNSLTGDQSGYIELRNNELFEINLRRRAAELARILATGAADEKSDLIDAKELWAKSRNAKRAIIRASESRLRQAGLIDYDGTVPEPIRNIILAAAGAAEKSPRLRARFLAACTAWLKRG